MSQEARMAATPFGCGQCLTCRINRARIWTHRILLENLIHEKSTFLTLTYEEDFNPKELKPRDLTLFLKRLRSKFENRKLRYYAIGEYGEDEQRPHYHLALFGLGIEEEEEIKECWPYGFIYVGDINKDSARYITGYVMKGWTKENDLVLKKLNGRHKEFMRCSNRPGIGHDAIIKIADNILKNPHYKPDRVIRELRYGKKDMPLGKYLTDILNQKLGVSEKVKETELIQFQQEIFDKCMDENMFLANIIREGKPRRIRAEKLQKIHKKKGKI